MSHCHSVTFALKSGVDGSVTRLSRACLSASSLLWICDSSVSRWEETRLKQKCDA